MEIKLDKSGFLQTKSKQETAVENLRTYHNEQQNTTTETTSTWKGSGGDSFRECAKEVSTQTLMGILMITNLNMQTKMTQTNFEEVDSKASNIMAALK